MPCVVQLPDTLCPPGLDTGIASKLIIRLTGASWSDQPDTSRYTSVGYEGTRRGDDTRRSRHAPCPSVRSRSASGVKVSEGGASMLVMLRGAGDGSPGATLRWSGDER